MIPPRCARALAAAVTLGWPLLLLAACAERSVPGGESCVPGLDPSVTHTIGRGINKDVDLLIVIDNSASTSEEQVNFVLNFPKLIQAMKAPALNNKIPNLHIGVISTDLGAGSYGLPSCEVTGGDGGKLHAKPRIAGCVPPKNPYIAYSDGVTNIDNPAISDPIERVTKAFQCIGEIGSGGCGFEMPLEAARRALDPKLKINPGFLRKDALLAVVFLADEDDCSAAKPQLFDPNQTQLSDPLGPLTSFRCFEFGVSCTCNGGPCDRTTVGPRQGCKPAHDWLVKVEDYVSFFAGLKDPGQVLLFAIAGPTEVIEVGMDGGHPTLRTSCKGTLGSATPAIRLHAVIDGINKTGNQGYFNVGIDPSFAKTSIVTNCSTDFSPALRHIGYTITRTVLRTPGVCLGGAPLTEGCGLACARGDTVGRSATGAPVSCAASCLDQARCKVEEYAPWVGGDLVAIPRCAADRFADPTSHDCGATCPCWRLVPGAGCAPVPYRLEVLRAPSSFGPANAVRATCSVSVEPWGGAALGALGQCR